MKLNNRCIRLLANTMVVESFARNVYRNEIEEEIHALVCTSMHSHKENAQGHLSPTKFANIGKNALHLA